MATDYEDPIYTPAPKPAQTPPAEQPATPPNTPPPASPPKEEAPTVDTVGDPQGKKSPGESGGQTAHIDTSARRTYNISSTIPDEFKGSTNQELIDWLKGKLAEYEPLSKEDLQKLRRKQRMEGIIAGISDAAQSVANLWFTHNYAPNMYDANSSMSAKTKARFDKEKAEREAADDRYFNYAMSLSKILGEDRDRALNIFMAENNMQRQERAYDDGRADREEDVAFRAKDFDERVRQWQETFDREGEWRKEEANRWERQFQESVRQFNVSSSLERERIGLEAQRLAQSVKQNQFTFSLGGNNGTVTLSMDRLNAQTVSQLFNTLPADVRSRVQGEPIVQGGFVVGYKPPTTEAMLIAIGANVENSPNTQAAIRRLAGQDEAKPAAY